MSKVKLEMVEIILPTPDSFLIIKETLTRIGLPNKDKTKLYQTCHILHKKKIYLLCHFKELFILDGRASSLTETDIARRNSIINYLLDRKFFTLTSGQTKIEPALPKNDDFTIITHNQKSKWTLVPKYVIGNPANKKIQKKAVAATATLTSEETVLS